MGSTEAVHDALRGYARPHKLDGNPLLRSPLIIGRAGANADAADRIASLVELVREAAGSMEETAREAQYFRALRATYLQPAPSQAIAAERLDVPFSTYRRHLKRGVEHVVETLWRMEIA